MGNSVLDILDKNTAQANDLITSLVASRLEHDLARERETLFRMESFVVGIRQDLQVIKDMVASIDKFEKLCFELDCWLTSQRNKSKDLASSTEEDQVYYETLADSYTEMINEFHNKIKELKKEYGSEIQD